MDAPVITPDGTDIVFVYFNEIQARVRNPQLYRGRPEVEVEITIRPEANPTGSGRVYWGSIGLMSKSGIQATVKQCKQNAEAYADTWERLIFDLCWRATEEIRKPPRSYKIGKETFRADAPLYQLHPIIQKDVPTIFYGDSGAGKSLVAVYFGLLVADDIPDCGLTPQQANVLYIDWETTREVAHERLSAVKNGLNDDMKLLDPDVEFSYTRATMPLRDWGRELAEQVRKENIGLVILDSLGMALSGTFNEGETVVEFFQTLRSLEATVVIIDHQGKGEGGADRGPIGSTYKKALARSVWEIKKVDEDKGFNVGLFHRKVNRGRLHKPVGFNIQITEGPNHVMEMAKFSRLDVQDSDELAEGLSMREQLHRYLLAEGARGLKDIYEAVGAYTTSKQSSVRRTLKNHFQQTGRGMYGLKAAHADPDPQQHAMDVR